MAVMSLDPTGAGRKRRAAGEMTPAQHQELAARYNSGPYWAEEDARGHGRGFTNHLDNARDALR
ncbi:hypothetical protein ACFVUB_05140 [Streptomyces niveus]|uniref:hypothetical protein n=1 Tax=Streptomyces niveus TaxID=193462 RepID=UPI0036DD5C61